MTPAVPFGTCFGMRDDGSTEHPSERMMFVIPDLARKAMVTVWGDVPTCDARLGDGFPLEYCRSPIHVWSDPPDADVTAWNGWCGAHGVADRIAVLPDRPAPELDAADARRFGRFYTGSRKPWLPEPWRTLPKTTGLAHWYIVGAWPGCCDAESAIYWNPDDLDFETRFACAECVP